jgi:DNA-binding response OmpR family regulator
MVVPIPVSDSSDITPAKVLIVDDNEQNAELLQVYMQEIGGIETIVAANGIEAIDAVAASHPDLILLDVMMPQMSGYEVCRQLKSDSTTRDIPVIMITALNESSDYERGMESGADDFLTRPLNRVEFLARVRSLLRIRKLRSDFASGNGPDDA